MIASLFTLGPLGHLLVAAALSLALSLLLVAIGLIAWVLSDESDTTDSAPGHLDAQREDGDPDPDDGEVVALPLQSPSEPPPSKPRRAA